MCVTNETYYYWTDLIPDDERLKYLIDPRFDIHHEIYDIMRIRIIKLR